MLLLFVTFIGITRGALEGDGFVRAKVDADGYLVLRGREIQRPELLLHTKSSIKHICCKKYKEFEESGIKDRLWRFHSIINIEFVDLSYNKIEIIDNTSFAGWDSVTHLRLDNNGMTDIWDNAFVNMSLRVLSLKGNKLRTAKFRMFNFQSPIELIDLSDNYLLDIQVIYSVQLNNLVTTRNLIADMNSVRWMPANNWHLEENKITNFSIDAFRLQEEFSLYLDRNLIQRLEGRLSELILLNKLSISRNLISAIDEEFFNGANSLVEIDLSFNCLSVLAFRMFNGMNNLQILDLSENKITYLNLGFFQGMPVLRQFLINGNPIQRIPQQLLLDSTKLEKVQLLGIADSAEYFDNFLRLKHLKWSEADMRSIQNAPLFVPRLTHLEFSSLNIPNLDALLNSCNISRLESLVLTHLKLVDIPMNMTQTSRELKDASFANNNIESVYMRFFPSTLEKLNLSNNVIVEVVRAIPNHLNSLKILDLQHNLLRGVPTYLFRRETKLDYLNLMNNSILDISTQVQSGRMRTEYLCFQDKCIYIKAIAMKDSGSYWQSNLLKCKCHRNISNIEGFSTISVFYHQNTTPSDLFRNYVVGCIQDISIYAGRDIFDLRNIADFVSELSSLYLYDWKLSNVQTFYLGCSPQIQRLSIVKSGITYINKTAFLSIPQLRYLDLSQNNMTAFEFGSLQYIPRIKELNLSRNVLSSIHIPQNMTFMEIVQLRRLDLSQNRLDNVDFREFYIFCCLQMLDFSYNDIKSMNFDCEQLSGWSGCGIHPIQILNLKGNLLANLSGYSRRTLKDVVTLDLSQNMIKRFSSIHIGNNTRILDASFNLIDEISSARKKIALIELYLAYNQISFLGEGCFRHMKELLILDLKYNQLKTFDSQWIFSFGADGYYWKQRVLKELRLLGNIELSIISMAINQSMNLRPKLSISNLCTIFTHNCPDYYDLFGRENRFIEIELYNRSCDQDDRPTLELFCVR